MRIVRLTGWPETEDDAIASAAETLLATYPVHLGGGGSPSWLVPTADIHAVMEWLTAQTSANSSAAELATPTDANADGETPLLEVVVTGGAIHVSYASGRVKETLGDELLAKFLPDAEHVQRGGFRAFADGQPLNEKQGLDTLKTSGLESGRQLDAQIQAFRAVYAFLKDQWAEDFYGNSRSLLTKGDELLETFALFASDWGELFLRLPPKTHVHILADDELPVDANLYRTSDIPFHLMSLASRVKHPEDFVRKAPVLGLKFALSVSSGAIWPKSRRTQGRPAGANPTRKLLFLGDSKALPEMEAIMKVLPEGCGWEPVEPPESRAQVERWRTSNDFRADIVHIMAHNDAAGVAVAPGRDEGSGFGSGQLDPADFTRLLSALVARQSASLVFLNTCSADLPYEDTAGMLPLGQRVIPAGVQSWVSTIGTVGFEDKSAFAAEFYRELLVEGRTVGDSMRRARLADLRQHKLTWTKYVLHGDPTTRLGSQPGGSGGEANFGI